MFSFWRRLLYLLNRHRLEADLEEEMRLHRELRSAKLGNTPAAHSQFGNTTRLKEQSRAIWLWPWLESVIQDLRYAARMLKSSPIFALSSIATLALGIGANVALFTLVDALLLRPLPVHDPYRLVELSTDRTEFPDVFCYPVLEALAKQSKTLQGVFTWNATDLSLGQGVSDDQTVSGGVASGAVFQTLGIQPQIGRFFTPQDDTTGSPLVTVLSDRFWQSRYSRNSHVVGKTIVLNSHPFLIIGVAPKSFHGMSAGAASDVFITIHANAFLNPEHGILHQTSVWWLSIFGRLKPGVTMQQANAELRVLSRPVLQSIAPPHLSREESREFFAQSFHVIPGAWGGQFIGDRYRQPLFILIAISGLVLLVACINIATLQLARAAARSRELSVRLAVGAARWRIIRQLLTESLLLSTLGTIVGSCLAWLSLNLTAKLLPFTVDLTPDARVTAFLAALVLLTALLFGTAPAFAGTDFEANEVLKQGRLNSKTHNRLNGLLFSGQIALSLVLLMGAFLFITTFENLKWQSLGFDRHNLIFVGFDTGRTNLKGPALANFYQQILSQTAALPAVQSAGLIRLIPISGGSSWDTLSPDLWPNLNSAERKLYTHQVSPGYFAAMHIPLRSGRDFNASDAAPSQPLPAILSATAARTYFPKTSALGQILRVDERSSYRIVGIANDAKLGTLRDPQTRSIYTDAFHAINTAQSAFQHSTSWTLAVRTQGNPASVLSALHALIKQSHYDITVYNHPINELIEQSLRTERIVALLAAFFAAVAALLVAIGLYGLLAYTITRRTTEIGIRFALGATKQNVLWLILKQALLLTLAGICVGVPAVLASGKFVTSMLYETTPGDPMLLALTSLALLLVAALASFLPAWRAATVDPATALRWE